MNILITNHHSKENKGDLAIILGLVASLEKENKDIKFSIVGRYLEEKNWWNRQGIDFFVPILSTPKKGKLKAMVFILKYYFSQIFITWGALSILIYGKDKMETLAAYKNADLIISKGGSFFREPEYKVNFFPIGIMGHLHQLILAIKFRKPVILLAQSFGPINNPYSRYIVSSIFRKCNLITTRDTESKAFLARKLNITDNVFFTGDLAFLVSELKKPVDNGSIYESIRMNKQQGLKCVGVTVRFWSEDRQFESYLDSICKLIGAYHKDHVFYFMPQVVGPWKEDDRRVSKIIWSRLSDSEKNNVVVVEQELEVGELLYLYALMDYFVATRLHSAIFSILVCTPVMAIGYEPKTLAIFTDIGIQNWVLDIRSVSPDQTIKMFRDLSMVPRKLFDEAREKGEIAAKANIEIIRDFISIGK